MKTVALIGRPNVGKSTLFNRLLKQRHNLMDDRPGVTRDRIEAQCEWQERSFLLTDTGGWVDKSNEELTGAITDQVTKAIQQADIILFVIDGSMPMTSLDEILAEELRKTSKIIALIVNKSDKKQTWQNINEYYKLGIEPVFTISSAHGDGFYELENFLLEHLPVITTSKPGIECAFAVLGRPNVGKSTFVNALLRDERVTVHEKPGTTRDPVDSFFNWHGHRFCLIDTAGIRSKAKQEDKIELWSSTKAIQTITRCDFAFILIDANDGITDGDLRVAHHVAEAYKPSIILVNKWDCVSNQTAFAREIREEIKYRVHFMSYAPILLISALTSQRISKVIPKAWGLYSKLPLTIDEDKLNYNLKEALRKHPPPRRGNRAIDVGPAKLLSGKPPTFLIMSQQPQALDTSYRRYLHNHLVKHLGITHFPVRLLFRQRRKRRG